LFDIDSHLVTQSIVQTLDCDSGSEDIDLAVKTQNTQLWTPIATRTRARLQK